MSMVEVNQVPNDGCKKRAVGNTVATRVKRGSKLRSSAAEPRHCSSDHLKSREHSGEYCRSEKMTAGDQSHRNSNRDKGADERNGIGRKTYFKESAGDWFDNHCCGLAPMHAKHWGSPFSKPPFGYPPSQFLANLGQGPAGYLLAAAARPLCHQG